MRITGSSVMTLAFLALFTVGVFMAWDWPGAARLFPWTIGIPGILLCLVQLFRDLTGWENRGIGRGEGVDMDEGAITTLSGVGEIQRTLAVFGWIIILIPAILMLGFPLAVTLFVFIFMRFHGGESWLITGLVTGVTVLFVYVFFELVLELHWPQGALMRWLG